MASRPTRVAPGLESASARLASERRLADWAVGTVDGGEAGARAFGDPLALYVGLDAVRELLARAEAGLPRGRQTSDATRRAALGVACAVAEAALAADLPAGRPLWAVEVPEDLRDLADRTGLPTREVRAGLALLSDAGVLERVVARGGNRLRVVEAAIAPARLLARVAWGPLGAALRTLGVSVAPGLAVARAVAARTAGLRDDGAGDPVALTQQELVATTLFGRTAVVAALRGLETAGAVTLEARRGTWTECRLCPAVFDGVGLLTREVSERPRPGTPSAGQSPDGVDAQGGRSTSIPSQQMHHAPPRETLRPAQVPTRGASVQPQPWSPERGSDGTAQAVSTATILPVGGANLVMEVGGVLVPLQPGMSVQPPPGAQLVVEVDPDGRRYLRLDAAIRLGPLP